MVLLSEDLNSQLAEFGMRLEFWDVASLLALSKKTKNPKKHFNEDISKLSTAIEDVGFKNVIFIDKDATHIPAGNGRILAAARSGKYEKLPVFRILDLNKAKLKKFALGDNALRSEKYDEKILLEALKEVSEAGEPFDYLGYDKFKPLLAEDMAAEMPEPIILEEPAQVAGMEPSRAPGGPVGSSQDLPAQPLTLVQDLPAAQKEAPPSIQLHDVPDVNWPSDNDLEIPTLSLKYVAKAPSLPMVKWGEISRKAKMQGTWHFYVEDHKFMSLVNDPTGPLQSGAENCVEVNFSVTDETPVAWIITQTFRKRWLARYWQSQGMRVIADLNVNEKGVEINRIGIPQGWTAWSTRGYSDNLDGIRKDYEIATEICGHNDDDKGFFFMIYGGGKAVQALAAELGAFWFPERLQEVSSGKIVSGLGLKVRPEEYKDLQ